MKPRVVYLQNGTAERPSVRITKTSEGIMWSITATGRSLNLARIRAEKAYRDLTDFVTAIEKRERQKINDEINRKHEREKLDAEIAWRGVVKEQEK
ncbi:MAG: hypothetical protein E6J01_04055 [Chloroflexi bacterium]|nr:MAG: hypothetical protein E6J01_04055 [Chloroflexota bacterium]